MSVVKHDQSISRALDSMSRNPEKTIDELIRIIHTQQARIRQLTTGRNQQPTESFTTNITTEK
jgi:hypothetical protein